MAFEKFGSSAVHLIISYSHTHLLPQPISTQKLRLFVAHTETRVAVWRGWGVMCDIHSKLISRN